MSKNLKSKSFSPDYITLNGNVYEKISNESVNVELDLAEDVLSRIDHLVETGQFVSRGDAIRSILRDVVKEKVK
ncbi:MAG: ribbon-helix-helix domain-containing protein [Bacteroidota bacterium]|jgi:hypothetical protein